MKDMPREDQAPEVPAADKQGAEACDPKWWWVEPAAWTTRMLRALEEGVKGGRWFSLIDSRSAAETARHFSFKNAGNVWREPNLVASWHKVEANQGAAGIDRQSVGGFAAHAADEIRKLQRQLQDGSYEPKPVRRVLIEKPGSAEKRPLGIPAVRDRVVQGAVKQMLAPIFEHTFAAHSYGFRPGRGAKDALRRVDGLLRGGNTWTVDADLKGYFDSIPHDQLMACVREHVADGGLLAVLEKFLQAGVMESDGEWSASEGGTPQGAVLSPLLANLYLNELDHLMAAQGCEMTRYADDFVVQCDNETQARRALELIKEWSARRGLKLHPEKTRITDAGQTGGGFDFLGYHFVKHKGKWKRWPREKSAKTMRQAIKQETPRTSGVSLGASIGRLNAKLRGWFEYFKHSNAASLGAMDRYIRGRLRSILRKREGRKGRALGKDHQRWPNAMFETLGLFCLEAARAQLSQPR